MPTLTIKDRVRRLAMSLRAAGRSSKIAMLTLEAGMTFAERYKVIRPIASGGMGAVYEVIHLETERRRALKVMNPDIVHSEEMRERFRLEARVGGHIDSDYIVDVFDAGIDERTGVPFLVMELLRGSSLRDRMKQEGKLDACAVVSIMSQASHALDKAHRAGVVHRDLKPENLFLAERDDGPPRIKLLDFGIAKIVLEGTMQANLTSGFVGTPSYMAPEQFGMRVKIGPATDVYALGMIAFTLLVGRSYWGEELKACSHIVAFAGIAMEGPKELASARAARYGAALPPAFDAWFVRATAVRPENRFDTASAAAAELALALGISPPAPESRASYPISQPSQASAGTATTLGIATTLQKTRSTKRSRVVLSLLLLLSAIAGVTLTFLNSVGRDGDTGASPPVAVSPQASNESPLAAMGAGSAPLTNEDPDAGANPPEPAQSGSSRPRRRLTSKPAASPEGGGSANPKVDIIKDN